MYGIQAINAHNGWAMAAVGWSIVLTGLTVLSFTISQLHKVLGLWDDRKNIIQKLKNRNPKKTSPVMPEVQLSEDIQQAVGQFKLLTNRLGDPFSLPKLVDLSEQRGLTKPHSTINTLLTAKIIVPDGKGYFTWYY